MKGGGKVEHGKSKFHAALNNTSIFRIAYIVDLFLCSIGYINVLAEYGKIIFFVWGLSIFFNRYIFESNIRKVNYCGWILLFIASNIVTLFVIGYDDGIWESLLMLLNMPIIFFLFYGLHSEISSPGGKKRIFTELYVLCRIFVWLSLAVNIISLFSLYAIGQSVNYSFGYLVIYENRFTGVYFNPNLLAFSSFCSMVCCHMLTKKDFVKSVTNKPISNFSYIITGISFALNLVVILLSDSNATAVLMICYFLMTVCCKLFCGKTLNFHMIFRRCGAMVLLLLLVTAGVFTFRTLVQTGATYTMPFAAEEEESENPNVFDDEQDELNKITFEHQNTNLDSGRINLLLQGMNVIKHHPLFGVGKGNITKYGNHYNNNKMKYSDFHNGYLTIIVCSGFVGFFLFAAFAACLCKRMTQRLFTMEPLKEDVFPCLFSFVFAYCVYSLFEKTLVYEVSFMVTFFWLILGYAAACMEIYEGDSYREIAFTTFESLPKFLQKRRKSGSENNGEHSEADNAV